MKIVPSEFTNSAWDCFILAKDIAHRNYQQDIETDNLLLALIKKDILTKKTLEQNNVNIKNRSGDWESTNWECRWWASCGSKQWSRGNNSRFKEIEGNGWE